MKVWDNIHYNLRNIEGYNKPFNFIMGPREDGKTTSMWYKRIYAGWKKNFRPWYYLVRNINEITDSLIQDIENTINDFIENPISIEYKMGDFKEGVVDCKIENRVIFRIVALSCKMRKLKLAKLRNAEGVFMDEYIINPDMKEHYLPAEAFKIKECYNTWRRAYGGNGIFKMYFTANPYSLFNPLFLDWNVDLNKLQRGKFYQGKDFVIHWSVLSAELKAFLLKHNPLYNESNEYTRYALEGVAINDSNIKIGPKPPEYTLRFIFKYDKIYIGIFMNPNYTGEGDRYYCGKLDDVSSKRTILCLDFSEMIQGSILMGIDERLKLRMFKEAMRCRCIVFENANIYYMIKEIYQEL